MQLRKPIYTKHPANLRKGVFFNQDNIPSHKYFVSMASVQDSGVELVDHLTYSRDLAPSCYHLFPSMKQSFLLVTSNRSDVDVISAFNQVFFIKASLRVGFKHCNTNEGLF